MECEETQGCNGDFGHVLVREQSDRVAGRGRRLRRGVGRRESDVGSNSRSEDRGGKGGLGQGKRERHGG